MKFCIVGAFDFTGKDTGGQPVKTRSLYHLLCDHYGEANVEALETYGWKKRPIKLFWELHKKIKRCDAIIMLPANNGVEIFGRLLCRAKKKHGKKIFYDVIGGWLPQKLSKEPKLAEKIAEFDGVWVETETMRKALCDLGLKNATVIPNFKKLTVLAPDELTINSDPPFALCTFSRVMKEKGIEDAIEAVKAVNKECGKTVYTLDIYGPVDQAQVEWFDNLSSGFPEFVAYRGVADPSKSVEVIKDYFALLFPTRFYTEGIPGTVIDAYSAGVPVISAKWESFDDVIDDEKTGLGYEFGNQDQFEEFLFKIAQEPKILLEMKKNCIQKAKKYTPEEAMAVFAEKL